MSDKTDNRKRKTGMPSEIGSGSQSLMDRNS